MLKHLIRNYITPASSLIAMSLCFPSQATIVELQISYGDTQTSIQVNLFDETTPKTVENFLTYVNSGAYTDSIIHRSIPGFITQGGGFTFDGEMIQDINSNPAVINEPVYSNLRGTIAMAKTAVSENSATNQWFFNLADNSENLDQQNGGFTVFGQIVEEDLAKMDELAAIQTCIFQDPFGDLPLVNFDCNGTDDVATENFIIINQVNIHDPLTTSASNLTPAENTLIKGNPTQPDNNSNDSGGGSIYWMLSLLVALISFRKLKQ